MGQRIPYRLKIFIKRSWNQALTKRLLNGFEMQERTSVILTFS
jgi:hypothetical protein